ncbi:SDR family NAD(P)-dependent oxidoreductase [Halostagnicola kamekurae]|uniref:NAD(P)-dependent dehydrogenase, short-chain alcohol dehydrogenase family n=1 Tax=Halostagnicola kamekurae TaxID=619731 RepID=A0A1I6UVS1_9EURY|nr:SDR family oxidoreductase [Halostagnicola kamekurae]SFT05530.1 NAD(P)-dependent dehydrogenase, short-chain alcohol dehydrogenase family [Halostagnicola kamekurae]
MSNEKSAVTVADKSAVIIGGTTGIGRGIARTFAEDGANVIATSRSKDAVTKITEELRSIGAETTEVTCDVRDRTSIENLRDVAVDIFGEVDVLINSAGATDHASLLEMTDSQWNQGIDVFLTGVFRACQIFGRSMDHGSIINISSMSGRQIRENRPVYCAAKSGVNGLTRAAAVDLAPNIRVNAIAPGFVKTELSGERLADGSPVREIIDERTPLNRVADSDEIAGTAVYLASDAASFTTGEVLTVDGGYDRSAL